MGNIRKVTEAELDKMVIRDKKTWHLYYKGRIIDASADFHILHVKARKFPHWKERDWEVV